MPARALCRARRSWASASSGSAAAATSVGSSGTRHSGQPMSDASPRAMCSSKYTLRHARQKRCGHWAKATQEDPRTSSMQIPQRAITAPASRPVRRASSSTTALKAADAGAGARTTTPPSTGAASRSSSSPMASGPAPAAGAASNRKCSAQAATTGAGRMASQSSRMPERSSAPLLSGSSQGLTTAKSGASSLGYALGSRTWSVSWRWRTARGESAPACTTSQPPSSRVRGTRMESSEGSSGDKVSSDPYMAWSASSSSARAASSAAASMAGRGL
mmetsp:Transcript_14031/g.47486  ORF Transcript_14031/g.47486 Transcript_14031/m.47486 type:complete len:275 (+) Transcript_14031:774-1598(+)